MIQSYDTNIWLTPCSLLRVNTGKRNTSTTNTPLPMAEARHPHITAEAAAAAAAVTATPVTPAPPPVRSCLPALQLSMAARSIRSTSTEDIAAAGAIATVVVGV